MAGNILTVLQVHSDSGVQVIYNKFWTKPVQGSSPAGHAPTTSRTTADDTGDNPGTQGPGVQYLDRDHPN